MALASAVLLAVSCFLFGNQAFRLLTDLQAVRETAGRYLPQASLYIGCSVLAFHLDGVFIELPRLFRVDQLQLCAFHAFTMTKGCDSFAPDGRRTVR